MAKQILVPYGADGNPLRPDIPAGFIHVSDHPGGKVHNGSEVSLIQTDTLGRVLSHIMVSIGTDKADIPNAETLLNGRPSFYLKNGAIEYDIYWDGSNWKTDVAFLGTTTHPTGTGFFPPKTGWPDLGGYTFVLDYTCWWLDDTTQNYIKRDYDDFLARYNLAQYQIEQWKKDIACVVEQSLLYSQDTAITPLWYKKGPRWAEYYTDECGTRIGD